MAQEGQAQPVAARVLVGQQPEQQAGVAHGGLERGRLGAPLKKAAGGGLPQGDHEPVQGRLFQCAIGRGAFKDGDELPKPGVQLEVPEMPDGHDPALRSGIGLVRQDAFCKAEGKVRGHLRRTHRRRLDGAAVILADAAKIFLRQGPDFRRRLFGAKAPRKIIQSHPTMPPVQPEGQRAQRPSQAGDRDQRQRLQAGHPGARHPINQRIHGQRKQILRTQS